MSDKREIGLKAITAAREDRKRSKHGRISGKTWLFGSLTVTVAVGLAWTFSGRSLAQAKKELLEKRAAAIVTLGKEWEPLRDRVESITVEAARDYKGDLVAPDAAHWDFRSVPGIYLRLRLADAKTPEAVRTGAAESVKDAFTGCLLREPNAALTRGDPDASTAADQPWNLRQAYASTRILSDVWATEVRESGDELRLTVFQRQFEKAQRDEIPLAVNIVKRAEFFLLLLDEDVPEAQKYADAGTMTQEAIQQVAHPARVHIVNLKTGTELVRLRRSAEADFRFAGERAVMDEEVLASMRRQVNNCALAQEVWRAIRPSK